MYDNHMIYIYNILHTCQPRVMRGPHASCHVASAPRRNGAVDPRATWARSPRQPRLGPLAMSAPPRPARHVSPAWARSPRQPRLGPLATSAPR